MSKKTSNFLTRTNVVILIAVVIAGVALNSLSRRSSHYSIVAPTKGHHAIIRIQTPTGGLCSAFVVSDKYAFTAGHCLDVTQDYVERQLPKIFQMSDTFLEGLKKQIDSIKQNCATGDPCEEKIKHIQEVIKEEMRLREEARKMKADTFAVTDSNGENTEVTAVAISKMDRRDFGLIKGDFSNFQKLKVDRSFSVKSGDMLRACGFPGGSTPGTCIDFEAVGQKDFQYAGISMFVPGISGGPVVDRNGIVVGIAVAANDEYSIITPSVGLPNVGE